MNWDSLPSEIINIILSYRKIFTCGDYCATKIKSTWLCYRTRVLIGRFRMLRYLREFRELNPNLRDFLLRSRL